MADRTLSFDSTFTVTVNGTQVSSPYTLKENCTIVAKANNSDPNMVYLNGQKWIDYVFPVTITDQNISFISTGTSDGDYPSATVNYIASPSVPIPDWANCFIKTSGGNKAVDKVWIKQNGQLVTVYEAQPTRFATDTWAQISEACQDGSYKTVYQVGDTKDIVLSTGETITVAIMGFDHDDLSDGSGKAPITVAMGNLLATTYPINSSSASDGGWDECIMRKSTMSTLLSQLPTDLQSVIKQVNKKATAGDMSTSITTSVDKLWLFAFAEIFSATSIENSSDSAIANYADTYNAEGTQYKYYENLIGDNNGGTNKNSLLIKKLSNGSGSANIWWLRSPLVSYINQFRCISQVGATWNYYSNRAQGVCFGFCIG